MLGGGWWWGDLYLSGRGVCASVCMRVCVCEGVDISEQRECVCEGVGVGMKMLAKEGRAWEVWGGGGGM